MGLLDKAKDMKKEEEPEEEIVAKPKKPVKKAGPPVAKMVKKKVTKPALKKKPVSKKPVPKKKPALKKKPLVPKVKREKKVEEEEEIPAAAMIEGLPEDLEFARIGPRAMAAIIDFVLLLIVNVIIFLILIVGSDGESWAFGLNTLMNSIIIPIGYFMFMEGTTGQTFGKRAAHVKVISLDGKPLNPSKYIRSAIWKGLFYPLLNLIDAIVGVFVLHRDTLQRLSQYNDNYIVVAVPKKKLKYGYVEEEEEEEAEEEEEEKEEEEKKVEQESETPPSDQEEKPEEGKEETTEEEKKD